MKNRMLLISFAAGFLTVPLAAAEFPFEKAGPNLLTGGDFEGDALNRHWKWDNNKGGFKAEKAPGHGGGSATGLVSTRTQGRGKFWVKGFKVPAGADVRVTLWVKAEGHVGGTWVNYECPIREGFAKFDLAGGTHDWMKYTHRTTVPTNRKFKKGDPVNLQLWFYVYGKGRLLIDDIECRVIEKLPGGDNAGDDGVRRKAKDLRIRLGSRRSFPMIGSGRPQLLVDELVSRASTKSSRSRKFGVIATDGLRRVFRDRRYRGAFTLGVEVDIARHEFEGAQVLIFAYEELKDVSVEVGDLKGPATFGADNIEVLPVAYGDRSRPKPIPWYQGPTSRHWPDPLLPNRKFTVEKGTVQPVYLRVYCPKDAKPGKYHGDVTIQTSAGSAKLPLIVNVRNVSMPVRLRFKSMLVGGKSDKPYLDLSLEQRMGIGNIAKGMSWTKINFPDRGGRLDFSQVEKKLQYAIDRGLNAFILASTPKSGKWGFPKNYSAGWKANMSRVIREYGAWLKQKGWLDMAYYNNIDEPGRGRWKQCRELYRMAKRANPDVKVFHCVNTVGALDGLKGFADTWDVYVQQSDQQQAAARAAEGNEIWWAICIWPRERPNLFVENRLIDARIVGWSAFKYDVSGFEYWQMTSWGKNPKDASWITCPNGVLTTAWKYNRRQSGDGYLAYPGPNGRPINSLRFESLRDGMEDNELLRMLRDAAPRLSGKAKAEAERLIIDGAVTNMFIYEQDPSKLLARRKRIFDLLEKAK